ncbi:MAG: hypothetical protein SPC96_03570, partial [Desulfovibrio sp.]|nr:hypothetical protein [Desulfovibrio sp.]
GLPQIKEISFFLGRGLWAAPASFMGEGRYGRISAQRQEPDGLVRRAGRKKVVERGEAGL